MKTSKIFMTAVIVTAVFFACKKDDKPNNNNNSSSTTGGTTGPVSPCDNSLQVGYEFNSNFLDTSCNGKHTVNMGASYVADRNNTAGRAISFNGSSSYVELPNDAALHPSFPFTISMWVNPSDSSATTNYFVRAQDGVNYYGYWLQTIGGALAANTGDGTGGSSGSRNSGISSVKLRSNTWTHIAIVFNGYNSMQMYFNGVLDPSITYSGTATTIAYQATSVTTAKGRLGCYSGASNLFYSGKMDKFKLWNRALSGTEITSQYNLTN